MNEPKLPPIEPEAFDGYKEEAAIHRDNPLPKKCNHSMCKIISSTELRCGCGVGWQGVNVIKLYNLLHR
jgi:hypothetical protein